MVTAGFATGFGQFVQLNPVPGLHVYAVAPFADRAQPYGQDGDDVVDGLATGLAQFVQLNPVPGLQV